MSSPFSSSPTYSPIAITVGDGAGIGPEIIARAFAEQPQSLRGCVVVGDVALMQRAVEVVARAWPEAAVPFVERIDRLDAFPLLPEGVLPVWPVGEPWSADTLPVFGQIQVAAGARAADAVLWAAQAALRGDVAAVVTAPLHKEALAAAGVPYPGHTELLQACAAQHAGVSVAEMPVRMMLANDELRTVLVSIHVSLRDAIDAVTLDNVLQTLRITDAAERRRLGRAPRIAVAGLNPHAGEGGLMGREELEVVVPAMQQARAEGLDVSGPHAPDTVFMRARDTQDHPGEFDVVVAMYHDQGLIPVKYLGLERGVNVTLGLPLVRTSPDHGTAFDIAGTGQAQPESLLAALAKARELLG
jgi:4-hydroxythreonine-4-phosphate dehydrogenase